MFEWSAVLSVPLLVHGISQALQHGDNDVRQWLPKGFAETFKFPLIYLEIASKGLAGA